MQNKYDVINVPQLGEMYKYKSDIVDSEEYYIGIIKLEGEYHLLERFNGNDNVMTKSYSCVRELMFEYSYVFRQLGFIKLVEVNKPGDIWRHCDGREYMIVCVCATIDDKYQYAMMDTSDYRVFGFYNDINNLVKDEFPSSGYTKVKKQNIEED